MPRSTRPLALVYRGGATTPGCAESVAALLRRSPRHFDIRYVGRREDLQLNRSVLATAALYVQPGGDELRPAWRHMRHHRAAVRNYVANGGRYLGFCLGGYLAGATPGFDLLPGDTDQYITTSHADIESTDPAVATVLWRGRRRFLYFQDGPTFEIQGRQVDIEVIASYQNGEIAAMTTPFGCGRVGVVGPHPEADDSWFSDSGLRAPTDLGTGAGLDLIDSVMN
ncbi:BPL-N domain-containing protein [Rhodococcus sp. APC 3903]|uniref:BPL-N domain-containing protein n=1 Tax=Rhodococcus sp. APC 3903 TaxID=3035193 RepID=UPI0025B411CC|nr:BPL-N domain-containing protein [Rhodococcus sp. APC 3903]MDN3459862.1 BPL-N domain-containing protein [Rhodococcus sp. APC 3903]